MHKYAMNCENCFREHDRSFASGRFCCLKCSRAFSTKRNRVEINLKVSIRLTKEPPVVNCMICSKPFTKLSRSKTCSLLCSRTKTSATKQKLSNSAKRLHEEGKIHAWPSRSRVKPSYPEQYFIDLFLNEGIAFQREVKIGKWFVDFVIGNVAIEIDGKQHKYPARAASDKIKDEYLQSQGLQVLRIEWYNPRTEEGKRLLYSQIEKMKILLGFA